jgi:hypothetical protein
MNYFLFASSLFRNQLVNHDTIRNSIITHPQLIPTLVKDSKDETIIKVQVELVSFLFLYFQEYPKHCSFSLVPYLMV